MATLQLNIKDYGKYALFEVSNDNKAVKPIFSSFDLDEVVEKAKQLEKAGEITNPAIEQVKDPHVCWNY
ncbi:MAG: hypothetical protein Q8P62_05445 [Candidatus Peregrinibacteria bacterium]|nr:hypothetical protein [Candidatus Peregrinibacteria bacterium]